MGGVGVLVDADEATQGNSQVGEADGLDDGQDDSAFHIISSIVLAMGLAGADVEVDEVAGVPGANGQCEAGEEGSTRGLWWSWWLW